MAGARVVPGRGGGRAAANDDVDQRHDDARRQVLHDVRARIPGVGGPDRRPGVSRSVGELRAVGADVHGVPLQRDGRPLDRLVRLPQLQLDGRRRRTQSAPVRRRRCAHDRQRHLEHVEERGQ